MIWGDIPGSQHKIPKKKDVRKDREHISITTRKPPPKFVLTDLYATELIQPLYVSLAFSTLHNTSVAKVLFRTAPENWNWQNRTVKFSSVLFSSGNSWSCSVLGSYIWEDIQNRTLTDTISAENMSFFTTFLAVLKVNKIHLIYSKHLFNIFTVALALCGGI